jgi:hypothetical protein
LISYGYRFLLILIAITVPIPTERAQTVVLNDKALATQEYALLDHGLRLLGAVGQSLLLRSRHAKMQKLAAFVHPWEPGLDEHVTQVLTGQIRSQLYKLQAIELVQLRRPVIALLGPYLRVAATTWVAPIGQAVLVRVEFSKIAPRLSRSRGAGATSGTNRR